MEISAAPVPPSSHPEDHNNERIAQAVAALLAPTIAASVEKAVQAGMVRLRREIGDHKRLNEA